MSIAVPDRPRNQRTSKGRKLFWLQRAKQVDKHAAIPKTVYVRAYVRAKPNRNGVTDEEVAFPSRSISESPRLESVNVKKEADLRPSSQEAERNERQFKFTHFHLDWPRAFTLEMSKPIDEMRERLERTIQQAITIPKIDLLSSYAAKIEALQRLHEDRLDKIFAIPIVNVKAIAAAMKLPQLHDAFRLPEMARSIAVFDKFQEVVLRQQEQFRLIVDRAFASSSQGLQDSIRKQFLLIAEQRDAEVDPPFDVLLDELRNGLDSASSEAIDAVLEIQTVPIPANKVHETVQLFVCFIEKHRGTNSRKVLIAVGAAIRKVLLNIGDEQLGLAAELMKSSGSLEVPIEAELEVAKMVVHRFRYAPNTSTAGLSDLADLLLDNAKIYSKTNLVNREYYGATALNSVLSIVLMRHKEASELIHHIESNSPGWFIDLVKSRLRRMAKEIENEKLVDSIALVDLMRVLGKKSINSSSSCGDQ